jgi:hypothetical protein
MPDIFESASIMNVSLVQYGSLCISRVQTPEEWVRVLAHSRDGSGSGTGHATNLRNSLFSQGAPSRADDVLRKRLSQMEAKYVCSSLSTEQLRWDAVRNNRKSA